MQNYLDLLRRAKDHGVPQFNKRTGRTCYVLVGEQVKFDVRDNYLPALASRQIAIKGATAELLGFFKGYTSAAQFRELGCQFWTQNANETPDWLNSPYRKGTDDVGRVYGIQWTDWKDRRIATSSEERDRLLARGFTVRMAAEQVTAEGKVTEYLMERSINQLEEALKTLLTDPTDRRIIVSAWRPDEFDQMALPPCHMDYRFTPIQETGELHLTMTMRSTDLYLGLPANIVTTSLFLMFMSRLSGMRPGTVTIQMTNAHLYDNHIPQTRELLARPMPKSEARVILSDNIKQQTDPAKLAGVFAGIQMSDVKIEGYAPLDKLPAPMAA